MWIFTNIPVSSKADHVIIPCHYKRDRIHKIITFSRHSCIGHTPVIALENGGVTLSQEGIRLLTH